MKKEKPKKEQEKFEKTLDVLKNPNLVIDLYRSCVVRKNPYLEHQTEITLNKKTISQILELRKVLQMDRII